MSCDGRHEGDLAITCGSVAREGETAEAFSAGQGFAVGTLRWWSSRIGREGAPASVASSGIRLAKVVRSTEPASVVAPSGRGAIIIEMHDARVRILVEAGVDRATLSTVLELVGKEVASDPARRRGVRRARPD